MSSRLAHLSIALLLSSACAPETPATLVREFELDGKIALLLKGTARTRFGDTAATPALRDFKIRWALVVKDSGTGTVLAQARLIELDGDTLEMPWFVAAGKSRLWVHDTHQLSLFDLATAQVLYRGGELAKKQAVFAPPFQLHARRYEVRTGSLVVGDRTGNWWLIDENLVASPTTEAKVEESWRELENAERSGCHTKREHDFWGSSERKRIVDLSDHRSNLREVPEEDEPGHTYLRPTFLADPTRHCRLDDPRGPLLFQPESIAKGAPVFVSLAQGVSPQAMSKELWRIPLSSECGASGLPVFADLSGVLATLVFASGAVCQVDTGQGKVTWRRATAELAGPAKSHRFASAVATADGVALYLWLNGLTLTRVKLLRTGQVQGRTAI